MYTIYMPMCKKTVEQIFEILILKFLAIFLNFKTAELCRRKGLLYFLTAYLELRMQFMVSIDLVHATDCDCSDYSIHGLK